MIAEIRRQVLSIYQKGLDSITPEFLLRNALFPEEGALRLEFLRGSETVTLHPEGRVFLVAIGKAAAPMAMECARLMPGNISEGIVVTKEGFSLPDLPFAVYETGHPVPDERGARAAEAVETLLNKTRQEDLVLVLVSGGASALLPAPIAGISLQEKQDLVGLMLRTNMDIHQINTVRKAVSRMKGGGLARLAAPARVVGLCLSDVPGDNLSSIGSGPTVPEPVDLPAARQLLLQKSLWSQLPDAVRNALNEESAVPEVALSPPINGLIGTNRHLLRSMARESEALGFLTKVIEEPTTGLNPEAIPRLKTRWLEFCREAENTRALCLISGGETTVEVSGSGLGGRCQELAAMMMPLMEEGTVFLAAGSDGNDGPTDAAGGSADLESWRRIQNEGIPYQELLEDNDSYHLLERSGNLIKVPPTRNNVMDVHIFLRGGNP